MPIEISDAPDILPIKAKQIWVSAYNVAFGDGVGDESATKTAWNVVKQKFKKVGGKWVTRKSAAIMQNTTDFEFMENQSENGHPKFRKQILKKGRFVHPQLPDEKFTIGDKEINNIIAAFEAKALSRVPVLLGVHDEALTERTIGEVIGLEKTSNGLDAIIEIADEEIVKKIRTKLSNGKGVISEVSPSIGPVLTDNNKKFKLVLWHLAIVTQPHLSHMSDFEEIAAALKNEDVKLMIDVDWLDSIRNGSHIADDKKKKKRRKKNNNLKEDKVTDKEIVVALAKQGIKVDSIEELKEQMENDDDNNEIILKAFKDAKIDLIKDGEDEVDVSATIAQLAKHLKQANDNNSSFEKRLEKIEESSLNRDAEVAVDEQVRAGKIVPAQKESMLSLYKSDSKLFESLIEKTPVIVSEKELGRTGGPDNLEDDENMSNDQVDKEVAAIASGSNMISTEKKAEMKSNVNGKDGK